MFMYFNTLSDVTMQSGLLQISSFLTSARSIGDDVEKSNTRTSASTSTVKLIFLLLSDQTIYEVTIKQEIFVINYIKYKNS